MLELDNWELTAIAFNPFITIKWSKSWNTVNYVLHKCLNPFVPSENRRDPDDPETYTKSSLQYVSHELRGSTL